MDMLNDKVSVPAMSVTYVSNKALKTNLNIEIYAPGIFCECKCRKSCKMKESRESL